MKKSIALTITFLLGIGILSSQQRQRDVIHDSFPEDRAKIEKLLDEIYRAAQKKDFDHLASYHLYGPKFTEFKSGEPRHDAEAARKHEQESLSPIRDFTYDLQDLNVNVFGDVAIATFHGHFGGKIGQDTFASKAQSTMVFVKDGAAWKIVHEHFSPLK